MTAHINWITDIAPLRLALMPCPSPAEMLDEDIRDWQLAGVNTVVSLLEDHEVDTLELSEEPALCERYGIEFVSFPITDRDVPAQVAPVVKLVDSIHTKLLSGNSVLIHCHGGIGRSAVISACVLKRLGTADEDVFPTLIRARGTIVPHTDTQFDWVMRYGSRFRG